MATPEELKAKYPLYPSISVRKLTAEERIGKLAHITHRGGTVMRDGTEVEIFGTALDCRAKVKRAAAPLYGLSVAAYISKQHKAKND